MPGPAVYIVPAIITAFVTGYVFHRFIYEPHIAPVLERVAEDFLASRRRHLAAPVNAGRRPPPPGGDDPDDIPLNERRRRRRSSASVSASTSDESGNEESAPLLGAQSSTTAREGPNLNENVNVNVNATLRRRPFTAVPIQVDNTIQEHSAPHLRAHSSPIAREESNDVSFPPPLPRRPRPVAFDNSNNHHLFGSEHQHQVIVVPTQDNRPRLDPNVTVPPSPAPSGVSRSDVHDWRRAVALHGDRRRQGQGQPMRVDRRPLPSPSTVSAVPFVPTLPPVPTLPSPPSVSHVLDEPNPDTLPQTPIYPTHVITDSSVPSTPSSTMSGGRDVMFTPPPQMSPLRSSAISTNAGANGAAGTNPSEISVLDPWNGAFSPQDGGLGVSVPSLAQSTTAASFQTDASGTSFSTSQLLVPPPNASGAGAPPQLPPFSPLSSMHASTHSAHSNQLTPVKSPQLPTLQSPPPQTPRTPPYLLTPSAQHPHHVHYPAPPNIAAVASTTTRRASAAATTAPAAVPVHPHRSIPSPPTSTVLSLSQSYPISEQGIEIVTPPTSPFRSPTFSDPYDLVVPGSPGPFGSPGSPRSPFIPLSIPPLPMSPPLPPRVATSGTGGHQRQQRQPLDLLGSAASMTTTIRPPSMSNPQPQSPSTSMFYSFTNDASTTRQTSPPARPSPPGVQSGRILSFPSEANHNQQQQPQHRFASPGIMSPMLSELDLVSGSELGSNDDFGSESSWSSARFSS